MHSVCLFRTPQTPPPCHACPHTLGWVLTGTHTPRPHTPTYPDRAWPFPSQTPPAPELFPGVEASQLWRGGTSQTFR